MFSQIPGALSRAILIAMMVATPSLLVPSTGPDTAQIVIVLSILAGFMTFIEYYGKYPSIIEFRFAPPFNRLKFFALSAILIVLSLICRGTTDPTGWTVLLTNMGTALGEAVDFPYSPVRMVVLMMPADADQALIDLVRTASGISYTVSLVMMFIFLTLVRLLGWPSRNGAFNVWVNLPLFDPTGGGDVLYRLRRDAGLNVVLGALLPFLIPAAVRAASDMIDPISIANPQTLIWTMTAWAFLPASMLMRGIAMSRIADMIEQKRRRAYAEDDILGKGLQRA
ncbi:hypothetical protein SAMN05444414_11951 [Roseovarius marisflavi]|uniref:Uncharacterized protein n=1 Tax=Roseovarius marisflavi TaxID=1054996 RepID=A0A1M7BML3_9RHOB|nr:hypothetical protein [Roseovarius marisflavi]SHL56190.1 hypothetical protein SAMN05444414_11951 [Roseovarius marisflavi]